MYKTLYDNARTMADRIQSGEFHAEQKKRRTPAEGLMRRDMLETEDQREDMLTTISRYLIDVKAGAGEATPLSGFERETDVVPSSFEDFADALMMSESSGRSGVQITARSSGRDQTMTGLFQFSEDRLTDFRRATGEDFTIEQFRANPDLQRQVFNWHIGDIDRLIDQNNFLEQGYTRDGLRAVAHLGGLSGMIRYARSRGEYNPSDKFGTSLSDYYQKFSGLQE
jgi:hypothetical protein